MVDFSITSIGRTSLSLCRGGLAPAGSGKSNGRPDDWDPTDSDPYQLDEFEFGELEFDGNGNAYAVGGSGAYEFFVGDEATLARRLLALGVKPKDLSPSVKEFAEWGESIVNSGLVSEVIAKIRVLTDDWPRSVAGTLFVDDAKLGVHYFDKHPVAGLFGWLGSTHPIQWRNGVGKPTKEEVFAELRRSATRYDAVELLPYEPLIERIYYRGKTPPPGDGSKLKWLIDRFSPETTIDRDLIQSAFMTPLWGGPPGKRPIFAITSDAGRGVGKSTVPEIISYIYGGHFDVSCGSDIEQLKTRMLTPSARTQRIALIDNVKSFKMSWAELEAMVTSPVISGKQNYFGEGQRPNYITWFVTVNGPAMATDLAQRSIIIKLARAEYSGTWIEETYKFIDQYRNEIIGDIVAALRAEPFPLHKNSRWATWEAGVLCRLPEPGEAQRVALERQGEANVELDEVEAIEEFIATELRRLNYDPLTTTVRIPGAIAWEWYQKATGDNKTSTTGISRKVRQMIREDQIKRLAEDPSRTYGRCLIWTGEDADPFNAEISNDLLERISQDRDSRFGGGWGRR